MRVALSILIASFCLEAWSSSSGGLLLAGKVEPTADVRVAYNQKTREWELFQSANAPGITVRMDRQGARSIVRISAP